MILYMAENKWATGVITLLYYIGVITPFIIKVFGPILELFHLMKFLSTSKFSNCQCFQESANPKCVFTSPILSKKSSRSTQVTVPHFSAKGLASDDSF